MIEIMEFFGVILQQEMPVLLRIVIPLSLTVYIFVYRERKETAYSTFKNKTDISFILYFFLITALVILTILGKTKECTGAYFHIMLTIFFSFWVVTLLYVFKKLINSIDIFKVYQKQIFLIKKYQLILNFVFYITTKIKNNLFRKLILMPISRYCVEKIKISMEIKSQILITKLDYNMPREFAEEYDKHLEQVTSLATFLTNKHHESAATLNIMSDVKQIYVSLLEDVNLTTIKSLDNHKYNEVEKVIHFYNGIVPLIQVNKDFYFNFLEGDLIKYNYYVEEHINYFIEKYYLGVYALVEILSLNKQNNNLKVLRMLVHQSEDSLMYVTSDEILSIFYSLIIDAVINNDVKSLTNTVNLADEFNENNPIRSATSSIDRGLTSIRIIAIVKSIELGHHGCAGFLIKNIMRKTDSVSLKNEFSNVRYVVNSNDGKVEPVTMLNFNLDSKVKILESLNFQVYFSKASLEYCFSKSAFLLYGQQKYLNELGVLGIKYSDLIEMRDYLHTYNKRYFINKVSGLHKEYGLSYLKNADFVNNL